MGSVPAKLNYNRRCFWKVKSFEFWTAFALLPGRVERRTIDMKNEEEKSKMENWKWTFSLQGQWRAPNLHFLFLFVCLYVCVYWFLTELLVTPSKKDITASYNPQPKTSSDILCQKGTRCHILLRTYFMSAISLVAEVFVQKYIFWKPDLQSIYIYFFMLPKTSSSLK